MCLDKLKEDIKEHLRIMLEETANIKNLWDSYVRKEGLDNINVK